MAEIVQPLDSDESVVLEIAASGAHMAAIGRWEHPTKSLHAKGLLQKLDEVNYVITDAGRNRMTQVDRDYDQALGRVITAAKIATAQSKLAQHEVDTIAQTVLGLAHRWSAVSGRTEYAALDEVLEAINLRVRQTYKGLLP